MYCKECGAEIKEGSKFCIQCGMAITVEKAPEHDKDIVKNTDKNRTKNKSRFLLGIVVFGVIVIAALIVVMLYINSDEYMNKEAIKQATECIENENYDEALNCYEEILEREGTITEIYINMADVYLKQGKIIAAFEQLRDGMENASSESDRDFVQTMKEAMKDQISVIYNWQHEESLYDGSVTKEMMYDVNGKIMWSRIYFDGEAFSFTEYNEEGNEVKRTYIKTGKIDEFQNEYVYDETGKPRQHVQYLNGDKAYIFEYDEKENLSKKVHCYTGALPLWEEYEYDSVGVLIKVIHREYDGALKYWHEYRYDETGKLDKIMQSNSDETLWCREKYEYDEAGNLVRILYYASEGNIEYWKEYEYDERGNRTKDLRYDTANWWYGYTYEYDAYGNCIKAEWRNATGEKGGWTEYSYDSVGNEIERIDYDSDGNIYSRCTQEYEYVVKE